MGMGLSLWNESGNSLKSWHILDVDHTLTALERVIGFHHIADEVEPKLNEGLVMNIIIM